MTEMEKPAGGTSGFVRATGDENDTASVADAVSASNRIADLAATLFQYGASLVQAGYTVEHARDVLVAAEGQHRKASDDWRRAIAGFEAETLLIIGGKR